jgi:hypothetical protein
MVAKGVELKGYGTMLITPINIKEQDWETVDPSGLAVTAKTEGTRAHTVYYNTNGVAIPNNQLCKKIEIEDEIIIAPKFSPSKEVLNDDVEVIEDNSLIYTALERKFYNVVSDHEKLKDLVLKQNKSLKFPVTFGSGWKIWNGILTNWKGKMLLVACRGDLLKELEKYSDDTVELEIEVLPQAKNMKKLVKAMAAI